MRNKAEQIMAHAFTRGMPGILDGHENIHILAQINVSLRLKWKKNCITFYLFPFRVATQN